MAEEGLERSLLAQPGATQRAEVDPEIAKRGAVVTSGPAGDGVIVEVGSEHGMHSIGHDGRDLEFFVAQSSGEEDRLIDRFVAWRGDQDKGRVSTLQQRHHRIGPLTESGLHSIERPEKCDGIGDGIAAHDSRNGLQERLRRDVGDLHAELGRGHEHAVQPVVEEAHEPGRRIEEVEGVASGRGVDHHEVESLVAVEVVQLLGRHVLLGARQRARHVAIEAVGQNLVDLPGVGRVTPNQAIEGGASVEHHGPQLAGPDACYQGRFV